MLTIANLDAMIDRLKAVVPQDGPVRVFIVPSWVRAWRYQGPPVRAPSKAQGRKGTRRAWKLRNAWWSGWRYVRVEPEAVLRFGSSVYCTERQYAAMSALDTSRSPSLWGGLQDHIV